MRFRRPGPDAVPPAARLRLEASRRWIRRAARAAAAGFAAATIALATTATTAAGANAPPVLNAPGNQVYEQGETIIPVSIGISDPDHDTTVVTVTNLPPGLSFRTGQVQGTVAAGAAAQDYLVTIKADDAVNAPVTAAFTITVTAREQTPPTVTISGPTQPQRGAFRVRIAFSEAVTGFEQADVTVGNGFARKFTGSGANYTAEIRITPGFSGTVTVDVAANVAVDADGDGNRAASRYSVEGDQTRPTVTLSGPTAPQQGAFNVAIAFSEPVTGFESSDVAVGNGSVTAFTGSGAAYTAAITAAATGTVTVDVAAHVATDATGNPNMPARRYSVQAQLNQLNSPPVITRPNDQTYEQGEAISPFGITVTDADGDPVTITVTGLPSGLSYASDQLQGTVAADAAAQAYTVTISAQDGVNAAVTQTFTISVTETAPANSPTNAPPVIAIPGSKTYERGEAITAVGIAVTDAEGDALTVTVTGLPSGLSYANGQVQGTVAADATIRAYTVTIQAEDGVNAAVTGTFTISVTETAPANPSTNAPPVIAIPGSKAYERGEAITAFGIAVTDAEGDAVTVTLTGLPSGLSYANGQVQGTVAASAVLGDHSATIQADDGVNAAVTETFTITVTETAPANSPGNAPPVITDPGQKTYERGEAITAFSIAVTDAEGDAVTVTLTGLPSGLSYANGQVQGTVAASAVVGDHTATIQADDGVNGAVTETFTISVTESGAANSPGNAPPVITDPGRKTYERGEAITAFSIAVTDAEGDAVTVTVTGLPSGLSYANGQVQGTVADDAVAGDHTVTIQADDGGDAPAIETFTITVTETAAAGESNSPPVITGPGNKTYERGEAITAFGITVTDADGDDVTVTVTGLPSGLSYSNGQVQGTVADDAAAGDHTVTILADDGGDEGAAETFTITVRARRARQISTSFSDHWDMKSDSLVPGNAFHVEEGDTLVVTFTWKGQGSQYAAWSTHGGLSGSPTYDVATSGTDYEAVIPARVVLAPQKGASVTIRHRIWEDGLVERNEVFQLGFRFVLASGRSIAAAFPVTILNDDRATITVSDATRSEGGDLEFTATLNTFLKGGIKVTPTFTDVTAVAGTDYARNTTPITFAGGANEKKTFTVSTTQDVVAEQDETFRAGLNVDWTSTNFQSQNSYTGNGDVIAIAAGTGTIEDDDARVTVADASASEGGALTFTVTLDKAVAGGLTVTPSFTDVTATKGTDYTENTTALSFAGTAGETKTVTVATTRDADEESDETFTVGLAVSGTQATVAATDTATGTIYDTNRAAVVTIDDANGSEAGAMSFTVTLDRAVAGGLTVTPSFTDGTATKGTDYTENTAALTFTGTRGETRTLRVLLPDDNESEGDETFTVGLTVSGTTATVTATDTGTGTIFDDDNTSNVKVPYVTIADSSAAEGDALTFTVTLGYPDAGDGHSVVPGGLTVTPSFTDGTATKGTDYTENTAALSFAGTTGESKTFTVATTEDADIEQDETFTVGLGVSGTTQNVRATDTATGTITNDDGALSSVTIADANAAEGDSITFTVTLTNAVPGGLTVTPSFTDVTATEGTDYTENTAGLTFTGTAGETQTFTVSTTEDADPELDENFTVGLSVSGTSSTVTDTDTATGTITNDDGALPAVTVADARAAEGDSMTFTVTLDKAVSGGLTVTPSFTDGTATEGTDYTENTTALTFAGTAGETQTLTVATTEDSDAEVEETFYVDLTVSGTQRTVKATDWALGTINDDDSSRLTVADASASEGNSMTFTVTLDRAVSGGLTVTPSYTDDTATEGADYTENTAGLTFAGTTGETQTFTVATTQDTEQENDETFTVGLTVSGTEQTVWALDTATGTITNDDGEPAESPAVVTVADASAAEGDALTFTVTLDNAVSGGLTVTPSFTDVTATEGTDYTENTAAITFAGTAGETQTFTVATTADTEGESDETFTVGLAVSGLSGTETVTATDTATGTIVDDESPALSIADASASEGDSLTFTVTLDQAVAGGLTVAPSFTDGTATKGTDYTENTAALTFTGTAGETQTFTVATTEDADAELDETFTVDLTVTMAQTPVAATDTATGTILDDDAPAVTIADASADEGDSMTFTVTLDKAVSGGLTVAPSFTDGTATKGTDYTENTAALTFAGTAGETQTFTVATTEDTDTEADETFTVGLAVSGTTTTVTATDTATGTILDDDAPAVTIADASASEGDSMTFTVTLDKAVAGGLQVTPSFTDVTATEGTDYTENTAALTFTGTRGETQTFTVATTEDTDTEADETFTVGLAVSGTTTTVTATDTATGTILDDDAPTVTIADASADEGDSMTFTVTLDKAVAGGLQVTPSFTDVTATEGTDYTENTAALTFTGTRGETQTFTVATTDDTDTEADETFTVGLAVSGTTTTVTATNTATGTILDDAPAVTIADASASEGDSMTFTVSLNQPVTGGLTVTPSFTDVTATEGTDYTENTAALTFTGTRGETQTFTVATTEDTRDEVDETFTVGLAVSGTTTTVTATDTAMGTISDDDGARGSLTIGDASALEGDEIAFAVTLDRPIPGGFTVTPELSDATARSGEDYRADTPTVQFTGNAGETRTLRVPTLEDTVKEEDETFTVRLLPSEPQAVATRTAIGTILDDDGLRGTLTVGDARALEGDELTFVITLDRRIPGGLTVTPQLSDGTATSGTDYRAESSPVRFAGDPGETHSFTVPSIEDSEEEGDETFTVALAIARTSAAVTAATATGTIVDDDLSPIHLRAAPARVAEAGGATSVRVTASRATVRTATTVSVTVGAADDPAVAGTDYRASPASFTVTIPAGSREGSAVVRIEPVDDSLIEPDEPLSVTGVAGSRQVTPATVTLVDDDASSAHLVVRMEPNVVPENAGPTLVTVVAEVVGATAGMALPVTMVVGDSDDTAERAVDYEPVEAFGVTIPVGSSEGSATFLLSPIEDELLEGNEQLTVTGSTLRLERASDQGTIRDEQLGEARAEGTGRTLFLLARAIGSESLAAIEERFAGRRAGRETRSGTAPVLDQSTGGRPDWSARMRMRGGPSPGADPYGLNDSAAGLERPEPHPFGGLGWIDGSTFVAPLGGGEAQAGGAGGEAGAAEDHDDAGWVIWGRAASTRTAVQATPVTQARGDLFTMHLGADTRLGKEMLLGLALSHSRGKLGYTLGETPDSAPAAVEGGLASVQPYAHWTPRSGLEVWGLGGLGRGSLQVSDAFGQADTGVGMRMAAGGVRQEVGVESGLAVKADVFHVALQSEAQLDLPAARATAVRARMLVEWQAEWAATASTLLRPRLEIGGRWDGGTDVGGMGSEVGGGVSVVNIRQKLELAVSGRYLVAHQEEGFDEWGASVTLRGGPGVEGRGPWVSLEPEWGAAASQVQSLVGPQPDPAFRNAAAAGRIAGVQPDRSRLAAGYALPEMGADFRLEGMRETLGQEADPKYGVRLSASFSW